MCFNRLDQIRGVKHESDPTVIADAGASTQTASKTVFSIKIFYLSKMKHVENL